MKIISGIGWVNGMLIVALLSLSLSTKAFCPEKPFAQTKFKIALDMSRQVWGDIQALCVCKNACKQERALLVDAVLGRLIFLDQTVEEVLFDSTKSNHRNDVAYLKELVRQIESSCSQLHKQYATDRVACMRRIISGIQTKFSITTKK